VSYETTYLIVAGVAWLRRSRVELSGGRVDDTFWLVTFGDGEPQVRTGPAGDATVARGDLEGVSWELEWSVLADPFETPHRLLRRVSPTHLITIPAISVSGRIGDRELVGAPGHTARLWGRKHARAWGWAHASTADGRWAHLLTASAPPLPRASQYATDGGGPGLPIARASVEPPRVTVGPYVVDAPVESFVGLRYLDTDGSTVWCYHSEQGHLRGAGADFEGAAMEIAVREPLPGWRVAP
jgi:hypothetical protein